MIPKDCTQILFSPSLVLPTDTTTLRKTNHSTSHGSFATVVASSSKRCGTHWPMLSRLLCYMTLHARPKQEFFVRSSSAIEYPVVVSDIASGICELSPSLPVLGSTDIMLLSCIELALPTFS